MRKLLLGFGLIFLACLVFAIDFTPYGNIDMQDYWNFTHVNYFCESDITCYNLSTLAAGGADTNCSAEYSCPNIIYKGNTSWVTSNEQDLAHDECSEISGCVVGAYNDISNFTGTLTNGYWCRYDSTGNEIDCDVAPYTDFGSSIDDTELTAEDFGDFSCSGSEDGCTLDANTVGNDELVYDTGQDLTPTSSPTFVNLTSINCIVFDSGGKICSS
ncbi:hypothetical protein J7J18_06545 [bacterium]|nr:hypothetical protein [bacterium]